MTEVCSSIIFILTVCQTSLMKVVLTHSERIDKYSKGDSIQPLKTAEATYEKTSRTKTDYSERRINDRLQYSHFTAFQQ